MKNKNIYLIENHIFLVLWLELKLWNYVVSLVENGEAGWMFVEVGEGIGWMLRELIGSVGVVSKCEPESFEKGLCVGWLIAFRAEIAGENEFIWGRFTCKLSKRSTLLIGKNTKGQFIQSHVQAEKNKFKMISSVASFY